MMTRKDDRSSAPGPEESLVLELLNEHIPLALIVDLTTPSGPDSEKIFLDEGAPDMEWIPARDEEETPAEN